MPKHLERQAYQSLLTHAQLCSGPDPEYDWDRVHDKNKRHAMNAVLDLEEANKLNREMYEALKAYEELDDKHANCEECEGEIQPELCAECFPYADSARLRMRAALLKAEAH